MGFRTRACIALALGLMAAGCAQGDRPQQAAVDPFAGTRDSSCYTVDLFTRARIIEPAAEVPAKWRGFLGRWGGGKWGGAWCHDLYVTEIAADGTVRVIETYGPFEPWGRRAAAFTRTGRIGPDGRLRLSYGATRMEYWLREGELLGTRDESRGRLLIAMERRSV